MQPPDNRIRTCAQINRSGTDGLQATAFELSPRCMARLGQGLRVGAGPSPSAAAP